MKQQDKDIMKKLGIALLVLSSFAGSSAWAANSATSTIGANLVTAISIAKVGDLNFGYAVPGGSAGTVLVPASPVPTRSVTGGVVLGNVGATSSAQFMVTGATGATFAVTLPGPSSITDGTNSMTVNTFTSNVATGTIPQLIYVGATLQVGANQVFAAPFTGTFNVTVNYN